jgi:hypothetical protein
MHSNIAAKRRRLCLDGKNALTMVIDRTMADLDKFPGVFGASNHVVRRSMVDSGECRSAPLF